MKKVILLLALLIAVPTFATTITDGDKDKVETVNTEPTVVNTEAEALALLPVMRIERTCEIRNGNTWTKITWNSHSGFSWETVYSTPHQFIYNSGVYATSMDGLVAYTDCEENGGQTNID